MARSQRDEAGSLSEKDIAIRAAGRERFEQTKQAMRRHVLLGNDHSQEEATRKSNFGTFASRCVGVCSCREHPVDPYSSSEKAQYICDLIPAARSYLVSAELTNFHIPIYKEIP